MRSLLRSFSPGGSVVSWPPDIYFPRHTKSTGRSFTITYHNFRHHGPQITDFPRDQAVKSQFILHAESSQGWEEPMERNVSSHPLRPYLPFLINNSTPVPNLAPPTSFSSSINNRFHIKYNAKPLRSTWECPSMQIYTDEFHYNFNNNGHYKSITNNRKRIN